MLTMKGTNGHDKLTHCWTSDLTALTAVRRLGSEDCVGPRGALSVRSSHSEGRTSLNDVSAVVGRKEGRTRSRIYLSLINLSNGVEQWLFFDKQEGHCLRISTQVVKWPERGDVGEGGKTYCSLDGVRAVEP